MSFALDPDETVGANISREAVIQLSAALAIARDEARSTGERIHDARTCCKRTRGLLRLAGRALPVEADENAAIRDAARGLSVARDAETLRATLRSVVDHGTAFSPAEARALEAALPASEESAAAGGSTDEEALLAAFIEALEPVAVRAGLWHTVPLRWDDVAEAAAATYGKARKAMRTARKSMLAADFHEWRKQAKYHWYHLRLLRRFDADRFRDPRERVKRLSLLLGDHHDLEVLARRLAGASIADTELAARLHHHLRQKQDALAAEALTLGADAFGEKPRRWRHDLANALHAHRHPHAAAKAHDAG